MNPFYYVFKNWTLFSNKTPRIEPFFNTTQRFCLWKWLKKWKILNMTQRIELFECDSKIFSQRLSKHWTLLLNMTHRIEPFCSIWLTEWNPSFQFDSKNWTLFWNDLKNWLFWKNESNNSNPFWTWFTELNIHFEKYDSKNSTLLFNMTYRIKSFSSTWLIEINPFFSALLKELNRLFLNMTLRFQLFSAKKYDSKNWAFLQYYSENWSFLFSNDSENWTLFSIWL